MAIRLNKETLRKLNVDEVCDVNGGQDNGTKCKCCKENGSKAKPVCCTKCPKICAKTAACDEKKDAAKPKA